MKRRSQNHANHPAGTSRKNEIDDHEQPTIVERRKFILHYQPRINLASGSVVGLEAIEGWNHPKKGLTLPESSPSRMSTLKNLETTGLQFVERALAEIRRFSDKSLASLRLTLRLHAASLADDELPDRLAPLAKRFGVPLHKIGIDISGIGSLAKTASALEVLTRIRMKGVELTVGEYGSVIGIQQLRQISATELKIDGSIVQNMLASERDCVMAKKLILIAHELNMKAVAEGVENEHQMEFLRQHGCDYAHGYYFGLPLRLNEMAVWLKAYRLGHSTGRVSH